MVRRAVPWFAAAVAAAVLAGCGSEGAAHRSEGSTRARAAIEQGILSMVRTMPGVGSVTSVHCTARGANGRRWSCRLGGDRPQDVAVTVAANGWWSADDVHAATAPQMSPDRGSTRDVTPGVALTGCCVPRP